MTVQEIVIGTERFSVGERIGKGGEGEVFALNDFSDQVVKIYNAGLRASREEKVRAMVREGLAAKTDLVAYPGEIVSDRRGNFIGFLMQLVSGYRPIHELYSPKSRQRYFPKADYRFVIRAALNVARSVGKVHQTGCVIGDLNHSGVLVSQDATVALIDADSFQFRLGIKTFPCVVGVPDFTPPELHGVNLSTVERTLSHDNFGLAVAIFHLLFMGRHPYAGLYKGPDISMGEAIAQNRFAFSLARRSAIQTSPPPGALTLDVFPEPVRGGFENAFGLTPALRPSALDWTRILTQLENSLNRCGMVTTHYYLSSAKSCMWCALSKKSGFDLFPDHSAVSPDIPTDTRGTEQAIREIQAFRFPTLADLLPQSAAKLRRGSSALREARNGARGRALIGLLLIAGAGVGLYHAAQIWFIWLGLGGWGWTLFSDREVKAKPLRVAFEKADERVQRELDAFVRRNGLTELTKVRGDLDSVISSYQGIHGELARELMSLKSTREARQRAAFLDRFSVRNANISGIGPAKTATLISFGIETAADLNRSAVLRVPGFGVVMTNKLMAWRRKHEARFRYDRTPNAQDVADEKALRSKFVSQKANLEATIRKGLNTLRSAQPSIETLPAKARNDQGLMRALEERAQTEWDLQLLGTSIPTSTVSLRSSTAAQSQRTPQISSAAPLHPSPSAGVPSCPQCRAPMRRKTGRYGKFWGCSRYPGCRGTRN